MFRSYAVRPELHYYNRFVGLWWTGFNALRTYRKEYPPPPPPPESPAVRRGKSVSRTDGAGACLQGVPGPRPGLHAPEPTYAGAREGLRAAGARCSSGCGAAAANMAIGQLRWTQPPLPMCS